MKKDTIIFDLDGTLLNTLEDLYACFNKAISEFGYPERSLEEIKSFVGKGTRVAIEKALPQKVSEEELIKIIEYFKSYYKDHMFDKTRVYDGIEELLKNLKSNGYKLAIVSNKYDSAVKNSAQNYFSKYIDVAIGEGNGIRKKPNPDGVLKAIEELSSAIDKSVYVGDSDVDIETAKNVGIPCISVLWGFRDKDFLSESGAEFFANEPKEIEKILSLV